MEIEFTYKKIRKIWKLFLKIRPENDSKICHFSLSINIFTL